jgi:hypothetical protein
MRSSSAAEVRDTRPIPSPARAASRTAVLDPRVSTEGTSPRWRSHSSAIARDPDPGSRSSHGHAASSSTATQRRLARGSSGAVTSTISLTPNASPRSRSSSGTRPVIATSAQWSSTPAKTSRRLPTCRSMSSSGCASRNARMSWGTTWSPADVTALMRSIARSPATASRAARPPCSSRPSTCVAYGANAAPAAVGRSPRPSRSSSFAPTSRSSAATAADTDGCVTNSSSAAAVTDPWRTTQTNAASWVRVTAKPAAGGMGVRPFARRAA